MARNRKQTEQRIVEAAIEVLKAEGFSGWGVNHVARQAGVDKVLIYRYFGSMDGLLAGVLEATPFWPDPDHLPDSSPEAFIDATLKAMTNHPHAPVLLSHPGSGEIVRNIRRAFEKSLSVWLRGFRERTAGHLAEDKLLSLPALIHYRLTTGEATLSARDLWRQVAPPLEWTANRGPEAEPEDLPPEML